MLKLNEQIRGSFDHCLIVLDFFIIGCFFFLLREIISSSYSAYTLYKDLKDQLTN